MATSKPFLWIQRPGFELEKIYFNQQPNRQRDVAGTPVSVAGLLERLRNESPDAVLYLQEEGSFYEGKLTINTDSRTIHVYGKPLEASEQIYRLAELLLTNPGRALTRDIIMRDAWDWTPDQGSRATQTVDVHMSRLRKLLLDCGVPFPEKIFETAQGYGYRFNVYAQDAI